MFTTGKKVTTLIQRKSFYLRKSILPGQLWGKTVSNHQSIQMNKYLLNHIKKLPVRNPDQFVSGEIHNHKKEWLRITEDNADYMSSSIQNWIDNGIDVKSFLRQFKGNFKGKSYNNQLPPKQYF